MPYYVKAKNAVVRADDGSPLPPDEARQIARAGEVFEVPTQEELNALLARDAVEVVPPPNGQAVASAPKAKAAAKKMTKPAAKKAATPPDTKGDAESWE